MPELSLTAPSPTDPARNLTAILSPNEASFLTGVFSDMVPQSDFSAAQAAVDRQIARLGNGEVAFVLPGTQIMIFPIGLIVTSVWLLLGLTAYGFGTVERWQYREMYRERIRLLDNAGKGKAGI